MLSPQNAQDFIRALKAPSDPPHAGGPFKIDIARQAWHDTSFYVPNKAEAIVDWLLSRMLKDKSKERVQNPVCDGRCWSLLADILTRSNTAKNVDRVSTLRAWLMPLLNRIPIAPIILAYFELLSTADHIDATEYKLVARCISVLWPLAVPKFNSDTLLDCFGAVVQLGLSSGGPDASCGSLQALDDFRVLSAIVASYRTSLTSSAAKRKQLYNLFLKKYLPYWLQLVPWCGEHTHVLTPLVSDIYDAGIESMFGVEIAKQAAEHKHDAALTESLQSSFRDSPGVVLCSLPRLFASYVQSVKRHKGALFSQGSNQAPGHIAEQVQLACMVFHATCDSLARTASDDLSWHCRVALLEVIERENLLSVKDQQAKTLLRRLGEAAVEALASAWDEGLAARTDCAVKILTTLTRIDYDLISPSFPVIIPRLLAVPSTMSSALQYLQSLLEYNSKTRSLPLFVQHVSEAFSVHHLERVPGGPRTVYHIVAAGPLASLYFYDELSRAVHNFLTPGQVLETIGDASSTLRDAYERFLESDAKLTADRGDGPRKKRKKGAQLPEDRSEPEYHAVSFALAARTLIVVLRSLPLHTVTAGMCAEAQQAIREIHSTTVLHALSGGFESTERRKSHAWQHTVTGALRLHYGLAHAYGPQLQLAPLDDVLLSTMEKRISSEDAMPELVVELVGTLMHQCSLNALIPEAILDRILDYLESHLTSETNEWSGKAFRLTAHAAGSIAVLHVLVDRWLLSFDAWASPAQLGRFASLLVNAKWNASSPRMVPGLDVRNVLCRMLRDAQFWELPRLRDAFLAQLSKQSAPLAEFEPANLLSGVSPNASRLAPHIVLQVVSVYEILLLTPSEYLPRATHMEFLKRGLAADVFISLTLRYQTNTQVSDSHLLAIREVLRCIISHLGTPENIEYLGYLLEHGIPGKGASAASKDLETVTMELIDIYQGSLLRLAKKGNVDHLVNLIDRYANAYIHEDPKIVRKASLTLIDSLVLNASAKDFAEECMIALRKLHKVMIDFSMPQISEELLGRQLLHDRDRLNVWSHVLTLGRWLDIEDRSIPSIGRQLSRTLLSWTDDKEKITTLSPIVLSILLGELQDSRVDGHQERAEYIAVAYLSFCRILGRDGMTEIESRLATACRILSTESFSNLLGLVYDGLPLRSGLVVDDVANLIRLSTILLCDAPEGTSKICQAHTTKCLNLFADSEEFTASPPLRGEVLNFLVRQTGDRPASLRTVDLSSLWSLLRALLAGSPEHEETTDGSVYHGIVNVLSAMVRLRRDLLLNTLPHLGFVLRRLIACLRSLRPHLGGKQSRLVMDSLPRWISPAVPLTSQESKALARLLTTLTTKTMIRVHGTSAEAQKPESLVRPFSKHAAYVLTAYIEAVNDPLCVVSLAVRKELQPGLFALCEMLGDYSRDAMMVSALDASGKATMKALWKEYEKQRYVGKG